MAEQVKCADPWGMPFQVGDRVKVYDGNRGSPTNGSWLLARVFHLSGPKVGVRIEESGPWDDRARYAARHFVPCKLVRHVDVTNAFAVIDFSPNAREPTHANVVYARNSDKPDEWVSVQYLTAKNDLADARALEKWTKFANEKNAKDPHQLEELSEQLQQDLCQDIERAIRSEVTRRNTAQDERTYQWRLLKLATSCLLSKYCVQPVSRLKQVVQSWKQNRNRLPLGSEAVAIADTWERFRIMKRLQMECIAQPDFPYNDEFRSVHFNSYRSVFNPDVTHSFFKSNYPPAENELKKFPVSLQEYSDGELPVQPPGPCTRADCDPEHRDYFCYKDEVRRSEPPRWRKAAMFSDPCDEYGTKTEEERAQRQKKKWEERSRCALAFNGNVEFPYRFGHVTTYPIALSSYFEPTVAWRKDLQESIQRRLTTIPVSAFYEDDFVFHLPYTLWATKSSPLRLELQPAVPNLVLDSFTHVLDGRNLTIDAPITVKIIGHAAFYNEKHKQLPSSVLSMTIVPSIPSGMLPGLVSNEPLVDLQDEKWKKWLPLCHDMEHLASIAKLLEKVVEMDKNPIHPTDHSSRWLHAISTMGHAIHLLRTLPILQPVAYLENDISNFENVHRTEPPLAKRGHIPEEERERKFLGKRPKVDSNGGTGRIPPPSITVPSRPSKTLASSPPIPVVPVISLPPPQPLASPNTPPTPPHQRSNSPPTIARPSPTHQASSSPSSVARPSPIHQASTPPRLRPSPPQRSHRPPPPPPKRMRHEDKAVEPARRDDGPIGAAVAKSAMKKSATRDWDDGQEEKAEEEGWKKDSQRWEKSNGDTWGGDWDSKWKDNAWKKREKSKNHEGYSRTTSNDWYS